MKKLFIAAALMLSCATIQKAEAQIGLRLNLNIGSQPDWGPVGYDHADYYYMPDVDAYYDVPAHQYVYYENNVWVHRTYLPARYRNYDAYHGYKVVVNQRNPWLRHNYYHNTYAQYRGRGGQAVIRDSRDVKYRDHWRGNNGRGPGEQHDNGNHFGDRNHGNDNRNNDRHDNGNHGGNGNRGDHGDHGDRGNGHEHGRP